MKFADRAIELLNVEGNMDGNFKFLANRKTSFKVGVDSVYYSGPYWDHREIEAAIRSLLDGKWLTSGENVMKFEKIVV